MPNTKQPGVARTAALDAVAEQARKATMISYVALIVSIFSLILSILALVL